MGSYLYIWTIVAVLNGAPVMAWQMQGEYVDKPACERAGRTLGLPRAYRNSKDGNPDTAAFKCTTKNGR